mmetsp:Transcript_48769/g.98325  ORF Transcript_48769/g.98325 Transcript_48769/m.98325 type:complete len:138 (-) Transcript_48769:273-686(-)
MPEDGAAAPVPPLRVVVGSATALKIQAVDVAFQTAFSKAPLLKGGKGALSVEGVKAASGVNEQPSGHEETVRGALNRLRHAKDLAPGCLCSARTSTPRSRTASSRSPWTARRATSTSLGWRWSAPQTAGKAWRTPWA